MYADLFGARLGLNEEPYRKFVTRIGQLQRRQLSIRLDAAVRWAEVLALTWVTKDNPRNKETAAGTPPSGGTPPAPNEPQIDPSTPKYFGALAKTTSPDKDYFVELNEAFLDWRLRFDQESFDELQAHTSMHLRIE